MAATVYPHITFTPEGKPTIDGMRIKVEMIATLHNVGVPTEQMVEDYPPLTLAQIYSALAYYYDHKDEIDRQIEEGDRMEQEIKAKRDSSPKLRERLKARGLLP